MARSCLWLMFCLGLLIPYGAFANSDLSVSSAKLDHLERVVTLSSQPPYPAIWNDESSLAQAVRDLIALSGANAPYSKRAAEILSTAFKLSHKNLHQVSRQKPSERSAHIAEDLTIYLERIQSLSSGMPAFTTIDILEPLLSAKDPRVRVRLSRYFSQIFEGTDFRKNLFPATSPHFVKDYTQQQLEAELYHIVNGVAGQGWEAAAFYHLGFMKISPMGKVLARIQHNSLHDVDLGARAAAAKHWDPMINALNSTMFEPAVAAKDGALGQIQSIRRDLAKLWLNELDTINEDWNQRLRDLSPTKPLEAGSSNDATLMAWEVERLSLSVRSVVGIPPLPNCSELLSIKSRLN
jgi:hypothetical protein